VRQMEAVRFSSRCCAHASADGNLQYGHWRAPEL
jgi:hypothetical protein